MSSADKTQSKLPVKSNKDELNSPASAITSNENLLTLSNKTNFDIILKESQDKILLIEFFAVWCGPCKMLVNKLVDLANFYQGKILIVKINVDDFEDIAMKYQVSAMPTFVIMKNQKKLEQFSSSKIEVLEKVLRKYVGNIDSTLINGSAETTEPRKDGLAKSKGKKTNKTSEKRISAD